MVLPRRDANAQVQTNGRHSGNETQLRLERDSLALELSSCQKDLHDINEFLLNELKVGSFILPPQCYHHG